MTANKTVITEIHEPRFLQINYIRMHLHGKLVEQRDCKMGRYLVMKGVGSAISEADIMQQHKCSGPIFMLGMIVISVSIISLIMFGCADGAGKPRKVDKPQNDTYFSGVVVL